MNFRYIQYIGKKPYKKDRLYGSGVAWRGYGDIQPVPAEKAPSLLEHPDELVEVSEDTYNAYLAESDDQGVDTEAFERARQRVANGGAAMTDGSAATTDGAGEDEPGEGDTGSEQEPSGEGGLADAEGSEGVSREGSDEASGEASEGDSGEGEGSGEDEGEGRAPQRPPKYVSQMTKAECAEYAEREFGEEIDVDNIDAKGAQNRVRELMTEHGLRK